MPRGRSNVDIGPRPNGRPRVEIPHEKIRRLVAMNCSLSEIAEALGMSDATLERRAGDAIAKGRADYRESVRRALGDDAPIVTITFKRSTNPMAREYVKLYQDGDSVAISTNVVDEADFMRRAASALADVVNENPGDPANETRLLNWLPQITDIVCKLRGYKAPLVDEQRVLTAGRILPSDSLVVATSEATNGSHKIPDSLEPVTA